MSFFASILTAFTWLGRISWFAKMLAWVSPFAGILGFLGPIADAVGAFLKPVLEALGRLLVLAAKSAGRGIGLILTNLSAFWVVLPAIFIAGGFYFNTAAPVPVQRAISSIKSTVVKRRAPTVYKAEPRRRSASPAEMMRRALGGN